MHEAHVTVVGKVATPVGFRTSAGGVPLARFRLASTVRRFDRRTESWKDGATSFYTVWAWRALAQNVASSLAVGEPVIVQGQLRIQEGESGGRRFFSADLLAAAVGHDLTLGTSAFVRERPAAASPRPPLPGGPGTADGTGSESAGPRPRLRSVAAEVAAPEDEPAS